MGILSALFGKSVPKPFWHQAYDAFLNRYSFMSGAQLAANTPQEEVSPLKPMAAVMKEYEPSLHPAEISAFLSTCEADFRSALFRDLVESAFRAAGRTGEMLQRATDQLIDYAYLPPNYDRYLVRYIIGEIVAINHQGGPQGRLDLWTAIVTERVR